LKNAQLETALNQPKKVPSRIVPRSKSRMPENSVFFEKIIPVVLVIMGVVTIGLILFAAGVLLGFVSF